MQNHLDSAGRTFTSMLPADPFGPPSHDFSSMNNHHHHPGGSPGSDFGHLINSNQNHSSSSNNNTNPLNNNHLHHNNNNHSAGNNNNNNNNNHAGGGGGSDVKPKKAPPPNGKKTKGRVKIKMEFIDNKLRRYTTFSKRKTGIMKKVSFGLVLQYFSFFRSLSSSCNHPVNISHLVQLSGQYCSSYFIVVCCKTCGHFIRFRLVISDQTVLDCCSSSSVGFGNSFPLSCPTFKISRLFPNASESYGECNLRFWPRFFCEKSLETSLFLALFRFWHGANI